MARRCPQSRLLNFPKIQDAMDLVREHGRLNYVRHNWAARLYKANTIHSHRTMNDIKGLEIWEGETREWNRNAGKLKTRAGIRS